MSLKVSFSFVDIPANAVQENRRKKKTIKEKWKILKNIKQNKIGNLERKKKKKHEKHEKLHLIIHFNSLHGVAELSQIYSYPWAHLPVTGSSPHEKKKI